MTPGHAEGGNTLDLENAAPHQIAHRLVGILSGRAWQQTKARDELNAGPQSPIGLAAMYSASGATRPAGTTVAALCGAAIAASELSGSAFGAIPGAVFDAALASVLLILFVWRPQSASGRLLPVLALVALIRPISLASAVPTLAPLAWYALAGLPLLVGAALAIRLVAEPALELHLRVERPRLDATIAATGILAGLVGYFLLNPTPLLAHPSAVGYAAMVAILVVFGGVLEELIFRGLVQNAAIQTLGGTWNGVAFTAALSMALYWGSGSIPYMLLMGVMGCAFGLALLRGASLWGIALSHGLMLVTIALLAQGLAR
ncbi:MAG TPA: CPBP family intramembrane glutamic endopeptidase [Polyangia bacterium]